MKSPLFVLLAALLLAGAGCTTTQVSTNTSTDVAANTEVATNSEPTTSIEADTEAMAEAEADPRIKNPMVYYGLDCEEGMKFYESPSLNIEFCYPANDDSGQAITVSEDATGVTLLVDGKAARKIAVVSIDPAKSREEIVLSYANPNPVGVRCVATKGGEESARTSYMIAVSFEQAVDLEMITQCNDNPATHALLGNLGDGQFFFYDRVSTVMHILSGEQDASLGYTFSETFASSIQPKK